MLSARLTLVRESASVAIVQVLWVPTSQRGQGIASQLLLQAAEWCMRHCVTFLKLDDMSDHYRLSRNLYVQSGFMYDSEEGPEMTARASTTARMVKQTLRAPPFLRDLRPHLEQALPNVPAPSFAAYGLQRGFV